MTKEIGGRSYRAPEVLFGDEQYTSGVDIWGVGCVLAELLLRRVGGLQILGCTRTAVMVSRPSGRGPFLPPF